MSVIDLEDITSVISNPHEEMSLIKTIAESTFPEDSFTPIVVIYDKPDNRKLVVSVPPSENFVDTVCRLSEALHLFPAVNGHAAVIAITSKLSFEDEVFEAINIFILSSTNAWSLILPYQIEDGKLIWLNEHFHCNQIDEQDFDDQGKDMVSMFHMYINADETHLSVSDILSYLSTTSAAVSFIDEPNPPYFDFSNNEMIIS